MAVTTVAGEGEFGVVHKAIWYGTVVAAKILKNTSDIALGDFRAEIEVLRKVCAGPVPRTHLKGCADCRHDDMPPEWFRAARIHTSSPGIFRCIQAHCATESAAARACRCTTPTRCNSWARARSRSRTSW